MLAVLAPLQLFIGDQHGLNTLKHQPIKIAAMEAHWDGSKPGALVHLRLARREGRDATASRSRSRTARSLILTHDPNGLFPGLKSVPPADRPPVVAGVLRLPHHGRHRLLHDRGRRLIGAWLWWRGRLFDTRWYLQLVAQTLVARLRRGDRRLDRDRERPPAVDRARHPAHRRRDLAGAGARASLTTLVLFVMVYGIVFAMGIYYINRLIAHGPARPRRRAAATACRSGRSPPPSRRAHDAIERT